jgi:hypothetical protein
MAKKKSRFSHLVLEEKDTFYCDASCTLFQPPSQSSAPVLPSSSASSSSSASTRTGYFAYPLRVVYGPLSNSRIPGLVTCHVLSLISIELSIFCVPPRCISFDLDGSAVWVIANVSKVAYSWRPRVSYLNLTTSDSLCCVLRIAIHVSWPLSLHP